MKYNIKSKTITVLLLFSVLAVSVSAGTATKRSTYKVASKTVSFEVPSDWQSVTKDVGVSLKLLGPVHESLRPVITLVPIDLKGEKIVLDDKKAAEESYKLGRLAWLQTFNGKSISFLPVLAYTINNKRIDVTQFGHLYSFNDDNFEEKSFYIRCKNDTYNVKTLIEVDHLEKWNSTVKQMIESFRCD